jgi:hypothetical protein
VTFASAYLPQQLVSVLSLSSGIWVFCALTHACEAPLLLVFLFQKTFPQIYPAQAGWLHTTRPTAKTIAVMITVFVTSSHLLS